MSSNLNDLMPHLRKFSSLIHKNPQVYFSQDLEFLRTTIEQIQDSAQEVQDNVQEVQDNVQEVQDSAQEDAEDIVSDEEEEGLPPEETFDYQTYITNAKKHINNESYTEALNTLNTILQKHSNSATATRLRSKVYWLTNNPKDAYRDMCVAQQIDYDEEYHSMHMEMKKAVDSAKETQPEILPRIEPDPTSAHGMEDIMKNINPQNLQSLLQNPALMNMAQNMMQDPQAMQNMMKMFNR